MELRVTTESDLDFVLRLEADRDAAPFIAGWPRERHREALSDPGLSHLTVVDGAGPAGFVILAGLAGDHRSIELRRIVIADRGRGLGRRALAVVLDHAFTDLSAHRVWLDVVDHNARARRAYESVGFVLEGVLREAAWLNGRYESLAVMSVLSHEWHRRRSDLERGQ